MKNVLLIFCCSSIVVLCQPFHMIQSYSFTLSNFQHTIDSITYSEEWKKNYYIYDTISFAEGKWSGKIYDFYTPDEVTKVELKLSRDSIHKTISGVATFFESFMDTVVLRRDYTISGSYSRDLVRLNSDTSFKDFFNPSDPYTIRRRFEGICYSARCNRLSTLFPDTFPKQRIVFAGNYVDSGVGNFPSRGFFLLVKE